ncbi:MAG: hypothetical protein BWX50_01242 [Euryarchaeota archaeon ADurb.Bin009]|nr:MAG: hypothetical protein BWX50_01242 [Euryarchaeota archaeon ADurb.Bin009]
MEVRDSAPASRCTKDPCGMHPDIKITVVQRPDQDILQPPTIVRHFIPIPSCKCKSTPLTVVNRFPPALLQGFSCLRPDARVPIQQHLPQCGNGTPAPYGPERPDRRDPDVVVGIGQEGDDMRRRTLIPDLSERPDRLQSHNPIRVPEKRDENFCRPGIPDRTERFRGLPPDIRIDIGQRPDKRFNRTRVA